MYTVYLATCQPKEKANNQISIRFSTAFFSIMREVHLLDLKKGIDNKTIAKSDSIVTHIPLTDNKPFNEVKNLLVLDPPTDCALFRIEH